MSSLGKRYRNEEVGGFGENKKKVNSGEENKILKYIEKLQGSLERGDLEEICDALEELNQQDIEFYLLEKLISLDFPIIISSCLNNIKSELLNKEEYEKELPYEKRVEFTRIKSIKLILNILLDISEIQIADEGQSNLSSTKLKIILASEIQDSLIEIVRVLEVLYSVTNENTNNIDDNFKNDSNQDQMLHAESTLLAYFQLLEAVIEIDPKTTSKVFVESEKIFEWLIEIFRSDNYYVDEISSNKVEILSIILQNYEISELKRLSFIKMKEFLDRFLVILATLGLKDTEVREIKEKEFIYNLSDIICILLLEGEFRNIFGNLQGLELMVKFIKEKIFMRQVSIKIVSFALLEKGELNNKFIQLGGLKPILLLLIHSAKEIKNNENYVKNRMQQETDEHLCIIVKSLLQFCTGDEHNRILKKLTEDNHFRLKTLLNLRNFYSRRISQVLEEENEEDENSEIMETLAFDAGLFIVQLIDIIVSCTCYFEKMQKGNLESNILKEYGIQLDDLKASLEDYSKSLSDDEDAFMKGVISYLN
ncbi:Catenin-beta-like protein [Cryptosporidium felis]|nr:Catenin-beta-like protein [Cryptosporidium felis]